LSQDHLLIAELVNNLDIYFVTWIDNVHWQNLLPDRLHVERCRDRFSVFNLNNLAALLVPNDNFDHGVELVDIEILFVELSLDDVQAQRRPLIYGYFLLSGVLIAIVIRFNNRNCN
jgi:hypothetical protein